MKLYRAGSPNSGFNLWFATEAQAKVGSPGKAIHVAELAANAVIRRYAQQSRSMLEEARAVCDVAAFVTSDGTYEYAVFNPHRLRILK